MKNGCEPGADSTLAQWLSWLEYLHPLEIELGLQRVSEVASRAGLLDQLPVIISVAGTNGKGSVVAMLTAVYKAAGYQVGSYTSPHITDFNERISVNGTPADDASIVSALMAVEQHRGQQSLTYFEFTTLAAMQLFKLANVDVAILEVGLGGRLDAVNIWDADCALVTSIAVDHESWLGSDRATIAVEKAGIARAGRALVVGDADPPATLLEYAESVAADCLVNGVDFHWDKVSNDHLKVCVPGRTLELPLPALAGSHQCSNAAAAVTALETLQTRLPVPDQCIAEGLQVARIAGRFERRQIQGVDVIIDVAHNPAAAAALALGLSEQLPGRKAQAVFGIMADKAIEAVVAELASAVAVWHLADLPVERALPAQELAKRLEKLPSCDNVRQYPSVREALDAGIAMAKISQSDYVLVFGSFFTVAEITD